MGRVVETRGATEVVRKHGGKGIRWGEHQCEVHALQQARERAGLFPD